MRFLDEITNAWGWKGVQPRAIVTQNAFGNVIFTDESGQYWRICPEELSCQIVATNGEEFARLKITDGFLRDWNMQELIERVRSTVGVPDADRCYCLKLPGPLGGTYAVDNIGLIGRAELISFSGDIARQIDDLPDGAQITLKIAD